MKKSVYLENRKNDRKTLLIVDDDALEKQELCAILSDKYNIITADNGMTAANLLHSRCADISLVLLNGSINESDEFTVMSAVSRCSKLKDIPVIILLSENSRAADSAYRFGVADYITVPLDEDMVLRRVNNTLLLYAKTSLFDTTDAILQQERTKREYYFSLSNDILFEYNRKNNRLTIGKIGAKRLCMPHIISNPTANSELLSLGENELKKLFSMVSNVSPSSPNIVYDCSLNINGTAHPCIMLIRALWDGNDTRYSRIIGKLVNACSNNADKDTSMLNERDSLTGLYSRKSARKIIEKRLCLRKNESYMMILLDIDRLKSVNEYCGYDIGNKVLLDYAHRFETLLGTDGVVARIGGDEFMLFMRCQNNAGDVAREVYDRLCADYGAYAVSASFGCSVCDDNGTLYDELYHKALVALHSAKESQTPICFYSADLPDFPHIHTPIDQKSAQDNTPNGVLPA